MLIRRPVLEGIRAGEVDVAFRRWERPRVRPGSRLRTAVGVLEVVEVTKVSPSTLRADDARRAGLASLAELRAILDRRPTGDVYRVRLRYAGSDPRIELRSRARLSDNELAEVLARLDRMDRAAPGGPWTQTVLELIAERPEVRAADLTESLGREKQPFKRDVRKLKELGLTESLETGYRLSPRGRAVLNALRRS